MKAVEEQLAVLEHRITSLKRSLQNSAPGQRPALQSQLDGLEASHNQLLQQKNAQQRLLDLPSAPGSPKQLRQPVRYGSPALGNSTGTGTSTAGPQPLLDLFGDSPPAAASDFSLQPSPLAFTPLVPEPAALPPVV